MKGVGNMDSIRRGEILDFKVVYVDSLYDYVAKDDIEYANKVKDEWETFSGLCYITKENEMELLVVKDRGVTTIGTVFHEKIHGLDYYMFSDYTGNSNLRELQENVPFHYWTEFHAEYQTYMYLIKANGLSDTPQKAADELREKIQNVYSGLKVYLDDLLDISIRQYGRYIALQECYPELPIHKAKFYPNESFMDIYIFLRKHRTFNSIMEDMSEWDRLLAATEQS
jgi:hypothetical protein